jgi:hypothetical protein
MSNHNQDLHQTDVIVRYLSNQMSEDEKSAFQSRMLFDPELRTEVSEMRTLRKAYAAAVLSAKPAPRSFGSIRGWVAAGVAVFAIGLGLYFQSGQMDQSVPSPVVPATQPATAPAVIPPAPIQPNEPVASVSPATVKNPLATVQLQKQNTPAQPVKAMPVDTDKTDIVTAEADKQPEAMAYNADDFEENAYLEEWRVGSRARQSVVLIPPDQNFKLISVDGKINLALKGVFKGYKKLFLDIYSNKQEDFNSGTVLLNEEVAFGADGFFTFSKNIALKPGLYYYVLGHTDEPLVVGKIEVR